MSWGVIRREREMRCEALPLLMLTATGLLLAAAAVEAQVQMRPSQPLVAPPPIQHGQTNRPPEPSAFKKPKYDTLLRDGERVRGGRNIAAAWFSDPTDRYRHTPFGSPMHPTTLTVSTAERRVVRLTLPKGSVFEDRSPRVVDVDGDGSDEVVVVRAYERKGAALAIAAVRNGRLTIIAETPPIGIPHRWLNPAGFADFDGDGKPDIALVVTPHIRGELQFWTLRDDRLEQIAEVGDVSNHVYGSLHLRLSAVADFNGDGIADVALPSQDRRKLRFFTLAGGKLDELGERFLPAPAGEDFEVVTVAGKPAVRVGLTGGRHFVVTPCRDIPDWEMAKGSC
jgi:hypothetical protein